MIQQSKLSQNILNRYTSVPILLDILANKRITLLSPRNWEDKNDSYYIEQYASEKGLSNILALCFTQKSETFHHWKVFAEGISGVRIEFKKDQLLQSITTGHGIRTGDVRYAKIKELNTNKPPLEEWPFIKRWPFRDEGEFRIIDEGNDVRIPAKQLQIQLSCISRVTLSPWMPDSVAKSVIPIIRKIDGCAKLKVYRSKLIETSAWRSAINTEQSNF